MYHLDTSLYPVVIGNIRIQDAYNLEKGNKWNIIHDILTVPEANTQVVAVATRKNDLSS
ncbi:hypothetical protein H8356DRAFT_1361322 [Neocallimastix lanati (nom. inval.)]|nr:hypothetical protein H8356DRAFT_1361322 [Neocallimastix sp. JGI-2020a]